MIDKRVYQNPLFNKITLATDICDRGDFHHPGKPTFFRTTGNEIWYTLYHPDSIFKTGAVTFCLVFDLRPVIVDGICRIVKQ